MARPRLLRPCDRREGESAEAHAAAVAYMEMGVGRTLQRVADARGISYTLVSRWAGDWAWKDRCREWDSDRARVEQDAANKVAAARKAEWEARRQAAHDATYELAQTLREKLAFMINFPLTTQRVKKDGKTVVIRANKWNADTMLRMAKLVAELEGQVFEDALPANAAGESAARLPDQIEQAIAKIYGEDGAGDP